MSKINFYLLSMIVLFSFSFTCLAGNKNFNFRKTRWGMSVEDVIKSEEKAPVSKTSLVGKRFFLSFQPEDIAGLEMTPCFSFYEGGLHLAWYDLDKDIPLDSCELYYERLKKMLVGKYGQPEETSTEPSRLSTVDTIMRLSKWNVNGTTIELAWINWKIRVSYESPDFRYKLEQSEKIKLQELERKTEGKL